MSLSSAYTAFEDSRLLGRGTLAEVVLKAKRRMDRAGSGAVLVFSDATGKTLDFNFNGSEADVARRLEVFVAETVPAVSPGPGRPRLGVVSREVSLLPRHWEWLATQPGGASATLRRLVDEARKRAPEGGDVRGAQERTYRFMSALGGDLPGYEEGLRALYRRDRRNFVAQIGEWPRDVREHAIELAKPAFAHD